MIKRCVFVLAMLVLIGGKSWADDQKVPIGVSFGAFLPSSSKVSNAVGSTWDQFGIILFEPVKQEKWVRTWDGAWYSHRTGGSALLIPVTYGVGRAFGHGTVQPYVVFRGGSFYGNVHASSYGMEGSAVGFNANATVGVIISRRVFVALRYDYFTPFADANFSGMSLSGGIRVADISM